MTTKMSHSWDDWATWASDAARAWASREGTASAAAIAERTAAAARLAAAAEMAADYTRAVAGHKWVRWKAAEASGGNGAKALREAWEVAYEEAWEAAEVAGRAWTSYGDAEREGC